MDRFTDEELAFLRHVRFGELPPRVRPEDTVETAGTRTPPYAPPEEALPSYAYWVVGMAPPL